MASQWQNFQRNLGAWRGSFTDVDAHGQPLDATPSLLTLSSAEDGRVVHFRLQRFGGEEPSAPPTQDIAQEYRTLGRQVVFFDDGCFCKGSLQLAPATRFGAEYGFIAGDRRHRLVQLFAEDGGFDALVLIREFRDGSAAEERPPLSPGQLSGSWEGQAATIEADWPEPTLQQVRIRVDQSDGGQCLTVETDLGGACTAVRARRQGASCFACAPEAGQPARLLLLPDGGFSLTPLQVSHRQAFSVEAGWLQSADRWLRLIRRYGPSGEWLSATLITADRR
ncbi:DUF3598 family protein [Cyanobium sp. CH-040]|uniref:DUF3598 family protein n=1 Tax=Cyanobium sp. CH-040 TaxID=2823708 RepID=UPI0020CEA3C2|nr:DUF3598 family protein [Cyanobium sp. CH-040]MCP9928240.1 DUF3598 family protein [Cyanobium sp. CH-040]